jgi:hypothetical protein
MLADLAGRPDDEAKHLRYFSFAHLVTGDRDPPDLAKAERDLADALARAGVPNPPVPVDPAATLFRIDTRNGWETRELFYRTENRAPKEVYELSPHDLLLLEYPHAPRLPDDAFGNYFRLSKLVRPVPFVRGDWAAEALKPDAPLAADLKSLTDLGAALKAQKFPAMGKEEKMPCGPKSRPFAGRNPVPAVPKAEPGAPTLPLGSWYAGDCQGDSPGFTFTAEVVVRGRPDAKVVGPDDLFSIRVNTSHKVNYVLLAAWADGQVGVQPTNKGGVLDAGESLITPDGKGAFQIGNVITGEARATEYFVFLVSTEKVPQPVIVRSRHASGPACEQERQYPVWRFFFEPTAKIDPARVVRRVVPVTVGKAD